MIALSTEESSYLLGLNWDQNNDTLFVIRSTPTTVADALTQRLLLSLLFKVFDPTVLFVPITVGAGLVSQEIWRISGQHWNKTIPEETSDNLMCVKLPLPSINTVPRSWTGQTR